MSDLEITKLKRSGFDPEYYRATYPDVSGNTAELYSHFVSYGWKEGRNPNPLFDVACYLSALECDIDGLDVDPLTHYAQSGMAAGVQVHPLVESADLASCFFEKEEENRLEDFFFGEWDASLPNPHLLFDSEFYRSQLPDEEVGNPLGHYLSEGWKRGVDPHPLFSVGFYLKDNPDVIQAGLEPLTHFVTSGRAEGRTTHPMVDVLYYQRQVKDDRISRTQVLSHYLTNGHKKQLSLHPLFDPSQYERRYGSLISDSEPSMCHFLREGWKMGFTPHGHFDPNYYANRYEVSDSKNPILHYIEVGAGRLYNPSSDFDSVAYLIRYEDVRYRGVDPFTHFVTYGHTDGRHVSDVGDERHLSAVERRPFIQDHLWRPSEDDLALAAASEWFDEDYYLKMNPDVREAGTDPVYHFLVYGTNEMRNPSLGFDTSYYRHTHRDFADSHQSVLLFHERVGAAKGYSIRPEESFIIDDSELEETVPLDSGVRWAVHAHVYYPDLVSQIFEYVERVSHEIDLFVSVHREENLKFVEDTLSKASNIRLLDVRLTPNRGRDLAPLFVGFKDIWDRYDVIGHIHTKRSPHTDFGERWRTYLFEAMMGHPNIVSTVLQRFDENKELGMVYPENWTDIKPFVDIGKNARITSDFIRRLGLGENSGAGGEFAAGSMCWMRSESFRPVLDLGLTEDDFAEEGSQVDGTLAHALERCLAALPRARGEQVMKYYVSPPNPSALGAVGGRWSPEGDQWSGKWYRLPRIARNRPVPLEPKTKFFNEESLNIHWVIPDFQRGAGGHMTIFRHVHFYEKFGHRQTIWIQNPHVQKTPWEAKENINSWFQKIGDGVNVRFLPDEVAAISGDAVIATDCWTAFPVGQMRGFKERFYFIQDYEPAFHPIGDDYMVAMDTYNFGYAALTAGAWLYEKAKEHNMWAHSWPLCVDREFYYPAQYSEDEERQFQGLRGWRRPDLREKNHLRRALLLAEGDRKSARRGLPKGWLRQITKKAEAKQSRPIKIAFYGRAYTTRRLVGIGFAAFHDLHLRGVDFELIFFGQEGVVADGEYKNENRGILSPAELGDLYRECDLGVVFSATNYSLIPLEMMACGLPIVEVDTESTRAAFPRGTAQFAAPNPPAIADAIELLIGSEKTREEQKKKAFDFVDTLYWEESAKESLRGITTRLGGVGMKGMKVDDWISPHDSPHRASVVIPTFNGGELFRACLDGLTSQKTNWDYEILVIDSGSSDQTVEIAEAFADRGVRLHQIPNEEFQHGATRNLGASMTDGEFIVFTTQDAIPANELWLENLIAGFDKGDRVAGVTGKHIPHDNASLFMKRDFERMFRYFDALPHVFSWDMKLPSHIRPGAQSWQQLLHFYSDNNSAMRRSVWEKLPYQEIEWGEDQVWAWEILKLGFEKVYVPDAVIKHSHNETYESRLKVAEAEARMFFENFGYLFLRNEAEGKAQYRAMCAADRKLFEEGNVLKAS